MLIILLLLWQLGGILRLRQGRIKSMLDFLLVLGQIPGTRLQITFYELIVFGLLFTAWLFRGQLYRLALAKENQLIAQLKFKLWQRRQLSLPV